MSKVTIELGTTTHCKPFNPPTFFPQTSGMERFVKTCEAFKKWVSTALSFNIDTTSLGSGRPDTDGLAIPETKVD